MLANEARTDIQNGALNRILNDDKKSGDANG
jgi:hypothetical protein